MNRCLAPLLVPALAPIIASTANAADSHQWKFTLGDYVYPQYSGLDLNLRWQQGDTHAWAGWYRDRSFGSQARVGVDGALRIAPQVQLQPSLQLATQGFAGGSLNLQVGDRWYGLLGLGRTNLKPYFNLNFDPNDAITLGIGHHDGSGSIYSLSLVADDRLHTRQRDWHLTARLPVAEQRVTLDLLRKSGLSDAGPITAWGLSLTWDWPAWFLRAARDPYQSFSAQTASRLSAGVRF